MNTLEMIVNGWQQLDRQVQKQYTRIGQKIPEEHLYHLTTTLAIGGSVLTASGAMYSIHKSLGETDHSLCYILMWSQVGVLLPDWIHNTLGRYGMIRRNNEGREKALDPRVESLKNYTRKIRLPIFLIGASFACKAVYDIANTIMNHEPLPANFNAEVLAATGCISIASSMYLKDQDPKLLEKKPSKIKALLSQLYDAARGAIEGLAPQPTPVPVPVRAYERLT